MLANLKALVVVMSIAAMVFYLAKPICLRFMAEADFTRRRNLWIVLTVAAFVSPSFWLFLLVAVPLLVWGARKDPNPIALYVLLIHVIPVSSGLEIPVVGINALFQLNWYRVMAIAFLMPIAWRLLRSRQAGRAGWLVAGDILLLAYVGLNWALPIPYEAITNSLRRGFLAVLDVLLLYYVASRSATSPRTIVETMATFCLACAIFAPLALFEALWGWLLYIGLGAEWGDPIRFAYLFRADLLRAQVTAGHSIGLGFMMATAFGFALFLQSRVRDSGPLKAVILVWMWVGLLAAYSRSPWVVAVTVYFTYVALGPNALARFFKASVVAAALAALVLVSPIGGRVIDTLPFVGTVEAENVVYRQRLAELSWELIQRNPFFGDVFFVNQLEELRQGQGIIDLMNTYASTAMFSGVVGLALFLGPFLICLWHAFRLVRRTAVQDPDLSLLGANLVACLLGTMLMMATGGFGGAFGNTGWIILSLTAGYVQIGHLKPVVPRRFDANYQGNRSYRGAR